MLIRFSVKRKDNNAPVPGARIEIEKAETVGYTDTSGKTEIITYWSGNWMYKVTAPGYDTLTGTLDNRNIPVLDFAVTLLYNAKSTPPPDQPGEGNQGRIGTSCTIVSVGGFGQIQFKVRHDRQGDISSRYNSYSDAVDRAKNTPACFETPPPPPKTTDEISGEVTTLQKLLNSTVGKIQDLYDFIAGLESWIIERIIKIILTALDNEADKRK